MTAKQMFDLNQEIEELIRIKGDDPAKYTQEELKKIAQYGGYGGLQKVGAKGHGILYEYYTGEDLSKALWKLVIKHGFKGGKVLEPSCGTGRLLYLAPSNLNLELVGIEVNPTTAKIAKLLCPSAEIRNAYFEQEFIVNNQSVKGKVKAEYDLVIGNPPYGTISGGEAGRWMEMGERKYTGVVSYAEYFFTRGLDLVKPGGLLCYLVGIASGKPWLAQGDSKIKEAIAEKADIVEAFRLPDGIFEFTDCVCDVIVLRKK